MPSYALIDPRTNRVTHLVEAAPDWRPPPGLDKVAATAATQIGELMGPDGLGSSKPPLEERRAAALARLRAQHEAILADGFVLEDGRVVRTDPHSLAVVAAMASVAGLAMIGATPWPSGYAQGWIAEDNTRIPLPTPQDAISIAAKINAWQSGLAHKARGLKDAVLSEDDPDAAIEAMDGWGEFKRAVRKPKGR